MHLLSQDWALFEDALGQTPGIIHQLKEDFS